MDIKKQPIDKEIISRRPRKREYSGYNISRRVPQIDKIVVLKWAFNPVLIGNTLSDS